MQAVVNKINVFNCMMDYVENNYFQLFSQDKLAFIHLKQPQCKVMNSLVSSTINAS